MKLKTYNQSGKATEGMEVSDKVFAVASNNDLIHQAYEAISSGQRQILAHTKTRGDRAGSGIKPWKQKGTGRARVGSARTPVWRKGGVIFGPRNDRNFKKDINKKMNAKAIAMVLSGKAKDSELIIVESFEVKEKKTKEIAKILNNLKIKGSILLAFSEKEKDLRMIGQNIEKVSVVLTSQLNVLDMLKKKNIVMSEDSVKYLEGKYAK